MKPRPRPVDHGSTRTAPRTRRFGHVAGVPPLPLRGHIITHDVGALTTPRSVEDACKVLEEHSDRCFDPELVVDFCRIAADVTSSFRVPDHLALVVRLLDEAAREEPDPEWERTFSELKDRGRRQGETCDA